MPGLHPIAILIVGMITVIGMIVVLRLNAFLALITAAILVSLLAPGEPAEKIPRVAEAFGSTAGSIGIVIALAAVIGKAMLDSGAADRIVRMFLSALGERRGSSALLSSGFVLSIPVFFDTVFYLLLPLARSMYRRTGHSYLKYVMAVSAGAAITHTLVPPTPGPLLVAGTLGVDLGTMIVVGLLVALPAAIVGLLFSSWLDRRMPVPLRTEASGVPEIEPVPDDALPRLLPSVLPIALPVLLISANTLAMMFRGAEAAPGGVRAAVAGSAALLGNANLALLISAAIAIGVYYRQRAPTRVELARAVEEALMSGGVIILITAAGGAFGAMLRTAGVGPAIGDLFAAGTAVSAWTMLLLGFGMASLLKIAQGSTTVAMITASAMIAAMLTAPGELAFHTVYLATAIASGALVGSWMNDSGFWIYAKMGGLTELESLKSWTPLLALLGVTSLAVTIVLALVMPLV